MQQVCILPAINSREQKNLRTSHLCICVSVYLLTKSQPYRSVITQEGKKVKPINPLQKSWRSSFHLIGKTYIELRSRSGPPPRLGQRRMRLVSYKSRGKCLIYLPFTTEISQKNTQQ